MINKLFNRNIYLIYALGVSTAFCDIANGQSTNNDEINKKLQKVVHLNLGSTTLDKVLVSLSEQTGVHIEPASYLKDHRLILQMENTTTALVLNTLAEINDWRWAIDKQGNIFVQRPIVPIPKTPDELRNNIWFALPRDYRQFMTTKPPTNIVGAFSSPSIASILLTSGSYDSVIGQLKLFYHPKLLATKFQIDDLCDALKPDILSGAKVPYTKLTSKQKEELLSGIVTAWLGNIMELHIFRNRDVPLVTFNSQKGEVRLENGKVIKIGTKVVKNNTGDYQGIVAEIHTNEKEQSAPP